jgi:hypothetical protein
LTAIDPAFRSPETEAADHLGRAQGVNARVLREVERQVEKWGVQHRRSGTGGFLAHQEAENAKAHTDRAAADGTVTWRDILEEEVREAYAEGEATDAAALVKELIQVAAVAVSFAVDVERRHGL